MSGVWLRVSDRMVAASVLGGLALAWAALLGFDVVVAFAGQLGDVGEGDFSAGSALLVTAYTVPRRAYELFPTAALLGSLLGLGALAARSELTALRAAGLSPLRICVGAGVAIGILTAAMMAAGETFGPWGDQRAQALAVSAKSRDLALARWSGLWAREGDTFLNARSGRVRQEDGQAWVELDRVRLYEFDPQGRLLSLALAARATHRDQRWTLFEVRRSRFHPRHVESTRVAQEAWESQLKPELLNLSIRRTRYLSSADLLRNLDYLERNGLDTGEVQNALLGRWFYPVNVLALCLAAMPFAFGSLRSGGLGTRLFLGVVFGLTYFLLQRLAVNLAEVYRVPLWLAHALPPVLLVLGAWSWYRRAPT